MRKTAVSGAMSRSRAENLLLFLLLLLLEEYRKPPKSRPPNLGI